MHETAMMIEFGSIRINEDISAAAASIARYVGRERMRFFVTFLGFVLALGVFRLGTDADWFTAVFFGVIVGLIAGVVLTEAGRQSARRIAHNLTQGWS